MIFYGLLLTLSISAQAFFGPSEETKKNWENLIAAENSDAVKKYIKFHPDEISYGLNQVNLVKNAKEVEWQKNEMGPEDWKHFLGSAIFMAVGIFVFTKAGLKINDGEKIEDFLDLIVIYGGGASLIEGLRLLRYSVLGREYSKDSIEHLKAIKGELLEAQQKNTSKK